MFNSDEHYRSIIEHRDEIIADLYQKIDELECDIELLKDENRELQSELSLYQRSCMDRN